MQAYLDNAATTSMDPEVISVMHTFMKSYYGNPSSVHSKGREARVEIEKVRKKIGSIFHCKDKEVLFTSGGTESNNAILKSIALSNKVDRIISSPIEHHSVLDSLEWIKEHTSIEIVFLTVNQQGDIDITELESLLTQDTSTLVSLMHGNNEIGNLLDLKLVGTLCRNNNALFHTDMVQTLGHLPINLNQLPIDYATASAHKIHGPKGVGFIYVNSSREKVPPFLHGGSQERSIRAGTENGLGIIGMGKAYELANKSMEETNKHFAFLKKYVQKELKKRIPKIGFNGRSANEDLSLANIISINLPSPYDDTLLFNIDMQGVCLSEGSACSSGASEGSHVINSLHKSQHNFNSLRLSFCKNTTIEEVDYAVKVITESYT